MHLFRTGAATNIESSSSGCYRPRYVIPKERALGQLGELAFDHWRPDLRHHRTNLRNLIGDRTLDETLVARDMINTNLREVLDEATNGWGVKVTRVEVQKIEPPRDITDAMSRQMKAEREKRAAVLEAEGIKQSQILQAEGKKQSEILKAEGDAQARVTRANAEAEAIKLVSTAAETYFKERAETMRRLEVLNNTLAQNTKYIVPSNSSLVNVLGLDSAVQALPKSASDSTAPPPTGPSGRSV
jgi:regulator of protease activity HflC (stomatin/prohibitin superfamily)